uniref:KiSS-1 metastasis suppressor n=1 Tax=Ovis aries TaxID=9940 RepID=A0AC11B3A5_SHEEP
SAPGHRPCAGRVRAASVLALTRPPLCPALGAARSLATDPALRGGSVQPACSRSPADRSPSPQLLFLTGLSFIIGLRRTFSFFFQRHKLKGTSFFLGGVVIVLLRWPLLGMFLETYGFFSLFRGFFPVAFGFLGSASNIPFLSALFQRLQGTSSMV